MPAADDTSAETAPSIVGIVLAAGAGSRFGGAKLTAPLAGRPLLAHAVGAQLQATSLDRVIVVVGAAADEVAAAVDFGPAEPVVCEDWREGVAASLRAGLAQAGAADAIVITLGDEPLMTGAAIDAVVAAAAGGTNAARATYEGGPGHPVLIGHELFEEVLRLRGDRGARDLLDSVGAIAVECDRLASPLDVDTPEDLALAAARLRG